ncbi:hypothetical protein Tco_0221833 [Tanacetum coccineum]
MKVIPQERESKDLEIQKQLCLEEMIKWDFIRIRYTLPFATVEPKIQSYWVTGILSLPRKRDSLSSISVFSIFCPPLRSPFADLDLPLEEADVLSFSDDSILRGIESDRDLGEDTTSIDALPLDDSMILPKYESFTFDDEPVMAEVNVFDEINTSELSYPGIGENVVLDERKIPITFTNSDFSSISLLYEVLPASSPTGSER